jgi:hypothetical protein
MSWPEWSLSMVNTPARNIFVNLGPTLPLIHRMLMGDLFRCGGEDAERGKAALLNPRD